MKLKKDDSGLLQLAFLVGQAFILTYYQVMLKLPFNPIKNIYQCQVYYISS